MLKSLASDYVNDIICLEYNKPTYSGKKLSDGRAKKKKYLEQRKLLYRNFAKKYPLSAQNFLTFEGDVPTEKVRIKSEFENMIDKFDFNYFGTITERKTKTETKFRNLIYGQQYITNYFDLVNKQIIEEGKRLLNNTKGIYEENYWFEQPNYFTEYNFMSEIFNDETAKTNIKDYQDKLENNSETIGDAYFESSIIKMAQQYNITALAVFVEYGKKNGQIHAHILLKHPNIQDVRKHRFKDTGKLGYITTEKNSLNGFYKKISKITGKCQLELIGDKNSVRNYVTKYVLKDIYNNASNNVIYPLTEKQAKTYKGQYVYNNKSNDIRYILTEKKVDNPLYLISDFSEKNESPVISCSWHRDSIQLSFRN